MATTGASFRSLDPEDWPRARQQAHRMLDDLLDHLEGLRSGPVWRPMPPEVRAGFDAPLPLEPSPLTKVHQEFLQQVLPYGTGNLHPGFMGWVHGGGNLAGMLGEMLAAGLNANLGGRDHAPIEVERQVLRWIRKIFGFPDTASGLFVTGTSMANFMALLVALHAAKENVTLGFPREGFVAYASTAVHGCVPRAMDMAGLGRGALRLVPADGAGRIHLDALEEAIVEDRARGLHPFLVVGTAGTVDTGAVDDLAGLADLSEQHRLWFHVDGAFGALAILVPSLAPLLSGLERADSLAFDFHKWAQVPYDAGYLMVRDGERHRATFAAPAAYLQRETRGLAAGSPWPCDFGPDLSRGFRALKTWFTPASWHGSWKRG
jgi:aromatic-L-amino-acid/L-tryptophan decarboxylase